MIAPSVGWSRPATRLSSVLLPQPECPIRLTNSPFLIARSIPASATKSPFLVSKVLPTDSTLRYLLGSTAVLLGVREASGEQHQRLLEQQADDADGEDRDDDVLDLEEIGRAHV